MSVPAGRRHASQDDEMVKSRFSAGLLSSSFTVATPRAPAAGAGSSSLIVLEPSASLLASSHRPIDSVRSQPVCFSSGLLLEAV